MKTKKILAIALAAGMTMGLATVPTMAEEKKTFVFGDTTFNAENEEADINPQNTYAGWACIRYGVGETLFQLFRYYGNRTVDCKGIRKCR